MESSRDSIRDQPGQVESERNGYDWDGTDVLDRPFWRSGFCLLVSRAGSLALQLAEMLQFIAEAMAQRAFGAQFVEQDFGFGDIFAGDLALEQTRPASYNFLLGKHAQPLGDVNRMPAEHPHSIWRRRACLAQYG